MTAFRRVSASRVRADLWECLREEAETHNLPLGDMLGIVLQRWQKDHNCEQFEREGVEAMAAYLAEGEREQ